MNAHSKIQRTAALFKSNRNQAVRIPKDMEFSEGVKRVVIKKDGDNIVISPVKSSWDDFFDRPPCPDFPERGPQGEYEVRESF
jgi:antitoxin VapB